MVPTKCGEAKHTTRSGSSPPKRSMISPATSPTACVATGCSESAAAKRGAVIDRTLRAGRSAQRVGQLRRRGRRERDHRAPTRSAARHLQVQLTACAPASRGRARESARGRAGAEDHLDERVVERREALVAAGGGERGGRVPLELLQLAFLCRSAGATTTRPVGRRARRGGGCGTARPRTRTRPRRRRRGWRCAWHRSGSRTARRPCTGAPSRSRASMRPWSSPSAVLPNARTSTGPRGCAARRTWSMIDSVGRLDRRHAVGLVRRCRGPGPPKVTAITPTSATAPTRAAVGRSRNGSAFATAQPLAATTKVRDRDPPVEEEGIGVDRDPRQREQRATAGDGGELHEPPIGATTAAPRGDEAGAEEGPRARAARPRRPRCATTDPNRTSRSPPSQGGTTANCSANSRAPRRRPSTGSPDRKKSIISVRLP